MLASLARTCSADTSAPGNCCRASPLLVALLTVHESPAGFWPGKVVSARTAAANSRSTASAWRSPFHQPERVRSLRIAAASCSVAMWESPPPAFARASSPWLRRSPGLPAPAKRPAAVKGRVECEREEASARCGRKGIAPERRSRHTSLRPPPRNSRLVEFMRPASAPRARALR